MSQGIVALWERVLERDRALKKTLSDASVVESSDDPLDDFDTSIPDDGSEPETDDPFADLDLDIEFDDDESEPDGSEPDGSEPETDDPFADLDLDIEFDDDESEPDEAEKIVDVLFEESADLWLSRSRLALEHALLSMGLTRDVFPTKRPLLIFGSHRSRIIAPEYHRVEVTREGWPCRLQSTELLTSTAAAKILASSHEGETVAVEVSNPLLARDRWIVLWPKLEVLPEVTELHQWQQVRRVVWCVNREQIGPQDVIDWLARWQNTPIRIALFRVTSFLHGEQDEVAQSKVLPRVRRTLKKFDAIKSQPWTVVGPQ